MIVWVVSWSDGADDGIMQPPTTPTDPIRSALGPGYQVALTERVAALAFPGRVTGSERVGGSTP